MIGLKDAREKTIAAYKKFNDFCTDNGIEDANDLADGGAKAGFKAQFDAMLADAQACDAELKKAEEHWLEADKVPNARERMSFLTKAVTGKEMGFHKVSQDDRESPKTLGQQFIESDAYKELVDSKVLTSEGVSFRSMPVSLKKTFAATDEISTASGSGAAALVTPFYLPGVFPLPQRPLTVRDVIPVSPMGEGDLVSYARQTSFDNAAAAVAQAAAGGNPSGAKPQSAIGWARETAPVQTIATWMAATRQALMDAAQIRSLIDNQGRLMIQLEEEDQVLAGNGNSPNLEGIQAIPTVQTLDLTGEDRLDGIRRARTMIRTGASRLQADFIVLHPDDSEAVDLLKDGQNLYRGGNPIGNFTFNQPIWSLRRVESEAVSAGTAIVGAGAGATIFERQPITVYTSDSHSDFFVKNLIAVLFEERIAFPVYYPSAFVVVTLPAGGQGSGDEGIVSD